MTKETRRARALKKRLATTALMFAGVLGAAGCSSVPDAVNPVEWYRGASDAVGGMLGGGEPEAGKTPGDPGTSANTTYPNLSTVPPRPTPSTTAEQREALKQGLIADRANARYTEPAPGAASPSATRPPAAAPQRSQPQTSLPQTTQPQTTQPPRSQPQAPAAGPAEPQAALPAPVPAAPPAAPAAVTAPAAVAAVAAPARTASAAGAGGRSGLWPNRPPPETPGVQASTTGRVGGDEIHRSAAIRSQPSGAARGTVPVTVSSPASAATGGDGSRLAERTTLDSAGYGGAAQASMPRSQPASEPVRAAPAGAQPPAAQPPASSPPAMPHPSEPSRPRVSEQSVIVNEDAIAGAPATRPAASAFGGRRYLASTIYFGHGSASVTEAERQEIARIAKAAAANGAAVQVIGHASARTADLSLRDHETANLAMSMKRAQAVADVMIRAGMPSDRVIVEALADSQPEFYEVMPSGEAGNRRTEIIVIY